MVRLLCVARGWVNALLLLLLPNKSYEGVEYDDIEKHAHARTLAHKYAYACIAQHQHTHKMIDSKWVFLSLFYFSFFFLFFFVIQSDPLESHLRIVYLSNWIALFPSFEYNCIDFNGEHVRVLNI